MKFVSVETTIIIKIKQIESIRVFYKVYEIVQVKYDPRSWK